MYNAKEPYQADTPGADGEPNAGDNLFGSPFLLYNTAFENRPDEEIALLAQQDDEPALEYLLSKYKNFVRSKARSYFLIGASHEDIVQEGMIGLFKAVRDYRPNKLSTFRAFAELCVTRQIITAIKTATRQKHIPLNSYISLNKPVFDEESDRTLLDLITEARVTNPEDLVIGREEFTKMEGQIGTMLSRLEQEVLLAYLDGRSYQQIARDLSRHVKSIDNALQRVKRKMEKLLEEKTQAARL
ncbi:MAG: RNA polymerase sporulation sigma factor SigH [Oscillospiraceae bacterium]|jgi:RNA polymerase sporulation-specific sigma factor|nr:RNA polymerase sporulation sigma factor SigH [Oscillospiraceae bacterium]